MEKGRSTRKHKQIVTPQMIESVSPENFEGHGQGAGGAESHREEACWEFVIERGTPILKSVSVGDPIYGTKLGHEIVVHSNKGALGYVPERVRVQISKKCEWATDTPAGRIIQVRGEKIKAVLCVRDSSR